MQYTLVTLALAASAAAQAVTSAIAPQSSAPAGCVSTYNGQFEIEVVNVTSSGKRDLAKRGPVISTLNNGVLKDSQGRTGYIAANYQFQYDGPPQAGAIYTAGWSICSNGSLALGGSAIFYECLSGTFYNLYDKSLGGQCAPIYIDVISVGGGSQPVSQLPDGQVTGNPVTQISDGQVQQPTGVVTQISDGQIQQPTGAIITQISDGQIQKPTGVVTQISDGQIQGPTGAVITQISDGQIQATTAAPPPSKPVSPITQISDGQIQAPTGTAPSVRPSGGKNATTPITPITPTQTKGASANGASTATLTGGVFAIAAMVFAVALL